MKCLINDGHQKADTFFLANRPKPTDQSTMQQATLTAITHYPFLRVRGSDAGFGPNP